MPNTNTVHFFLIGSVGVGKSAIIQQIRGGDFLAEHHPTQYTLLEPEISLSGHRVAFWDTRGSDSVDLLKLSVPSRRCALVLVYDITDDGSFQHIEKSLREFQSRGYTGPAVLLGNKIDQKPERKVQEHSVQALARSSNSRIETSSAITSQLARAPFDRLLADTSFLQHLLRHEQGPPLPHGPENSRANTVNAKRARGGCFITPLLRVQALFSVKGEAASNEVEMSRTPLSTVVANSASPSDEEGTARQDRRLDSPPPSQDLISRPSKPADEPGNIQDQGSSSPLIEANEQDLGVALPRWGGGHVHSASERRGPIQQARETSVEELEHTAGPVGSSPESILPPPWRSEDSQQPQCYRVLQDDLLPECAATVRSEILVEGYMIKKLPVLMSADENTHLSQFLYGGTVYIQVHRPTILKQLIQSFRSRLYYSQESQPGVCTIAELWYVITDERNKICFKAHDLLLQTTRRVFASNLSQQFQDTDFTNTIWKALRQHAPHAWACRYVWSLFVYHRHSTMTHTHDGREIQGVLVDVSADRAALSLCLRSREGKHMIQVLWTDFVMINSLLQKLTISHNIGH